MTAARLLSFCLSLSLAACLGTTPTTTPDPDDVAGWVDRVLVAEDARDGDDPILRGALTHDDPAVRFSAYRALGRIGDVETLPLLVDAIGKETVPELRSEAIFALGRTGQSSIVDVVERFILAADAPTRADLARALGMSGDERGLISLLDSVEDPSPAVRGEAALALALMLGGRTDPFVGRAFAPFRPLGERMVSDENGEVRWRAAYACLKLGATEYRPRFLQALRDPDPRVRLVACEGLGALPADEETTAALVETLEDADWRVVTEATKALAGTESRVAREALARWLGAHESLHVRAAAARSLAAADAPPEVGVALVEALGDPSEIVRDEVIEALAVTLEAGAAVTLLEAAVSGTTAAPPSRYLRSRVARAAALVPDERGFVVVAGLLEDEDVAVRTAATGALGSFPEHAEEVVPWLREALATHELALREAAATAAASLRARGLVPDLAAALNDSPGPDFVETRMSILRALGVLGGTAASDALQDALQDEERAVRLQARSELALLGGSIPKLPRRPPPARAIVPRYGVDFTYQEERPRVRLVTNRGPFDLELMPDEAPHHALLFLERCRQGFYDGLPFHRVVPDFVVQGLDPRGDGYGTGGASLRSEVNPLRYERGAVGMPDAGLDTGGCQLFVTFRPQPRLDARYTIFARVVAGMDVLERLDVGDRVDYVIVESAAPQPVQSR